jgi:ribosomal protein S18 acetylase RimI-like enzyme
MFMEYKAYNFQYHHSTHIDGTPNGVVAFATRGWLEICENGWAWDQWLPFNPSDQCVYSTYDDVICGIIVFRIDEKLRKCHIQLGYVDPNFRGSNIYDSLWGSVKINAREAKCNVIESYVHPYNRPMIKKLKKQKRDIAFYVVRSAP